MKRFAQLFPRFVNYTLAYRAEIWLWFVLDSIPLIVMLLMWLRLGENGNAFAGYDLGRLLTYYIFTFLIGNLVAAHFISWRVEQVLSGDIDTYLSRPLGYLQNLFYHHIADKLLSLVIKLPFIAALWIVVQVLDINLAITMNGPQILQLIILIVFGFLIEFFISTAIVMSGFWLEGAAGLEHFKWFITAMVSGSAFPLVFLPASLRQLAEALPLKYLYAVPASVFDNSYRMLAWDWLYLTSFLAVLVIIVSLLWAAARRHYTGYGG